MRFRDDIDPENTWVWSDPHFHHTNIAAFCHRPPDHDQLILAEVRKEVPDDATLLCLGDINYGNNARFKHIVAKELPGKRRILIRGNHDRQSDGFYKKSGLLTTAPFQIGYHRSDMYCLGCDGSGWVGSFMGEPCPNCSGTGREERDAFVVSFSHYPWNDAEDGGPQPENHLRVHGHIHNNGYTRQAFVPFLKGHVNVSVEQTRYKPVNLKLLLDAVLLGQYPETTEEQLEEVRRKRDENYASKESV
jgi:calcineurin-like phosphoesterase family protein